MHTFGSKLNFNCHIHVIYTLGGQNLTTGNWKYIPFAAAESIKKRFKTIVLSRLRRERTDFNILPEIKKLWLERFKTANLYEVQNKLWEKEWYFYIGEELDSADLATKYVGRYAKRPCLAETRIKYYSKKEFVIKFEYRDKITKEYQEIETDPVSFIGLLVRHIPEKYFHMIRYYGAYGAACRAKILKNIYQQLISWFGTANLLFGPKKMTWRERKLISTGIDPLKCHSCHITMLLTEIVYRARDGTLEKISFF